MRSFPELRPRPWDALPALIVAVLAVVCALVVWGGTGSTGELTMVVSVDGQVTETVALSRLSGSETREIDAGGYHLQLSISPTEVRVESSDCPTQDCVHTGRISRSGQSIVCLPARVVIELEGGAANDGVDAVLG